MEAIIIILIYGYGVLLLEQYAVLTLVVGSCRLFFWLETLVVGCKPRRVKAVKGPQDCPESRQGSTRHGREGESSTLDKRSVRDGQHNGHCALCTAGVGVQASGTRGGQVAVAVAP